MRPVDEEGCLVILVRSQNIDESREISHYCKMLLVTDVGSIAVFLENIQWLG